MTTEKSGTSGSAILMAFLAGASAGAVAALLLAPASGRETRQRLREVTGRGSDQIRRFPGAVKQAGAAARDAFTSAYESGNAD